MNLEETVGIPTDPLPRYELEQLTARTPVRAFGGNSKSRLANLRSDGDEPWRDATLGYLTPAANGASTPRNYAEP